MEGLKVVNAVVSLFEVVRISGRCVVMMPSVDTFWKIVEIVGVVKDMRFVVWS